MKTKIILLFSALFMTTTSLIGAENEPLKVKKFNYSDEVNYETTFETIESNVQGMIIYSHSMKNSNDLLISYLKDGDKELTPLAFVSEEGNVINYKDINNRKIVVSLLYDFEKLTNISYFEINDSKEGFALGCLGGSTMGCYRLALNSCRADTSSWGCNDMCNLAGWRCNAAILASCAAHCNITSAD